MHVALKLSQQVKIDTLDSPTGARGVPHITTWSVGNTDGCVCVCVGLGGLTLSREGIMLTLAHP